MLSFYRIGRGLQGSWSAGVLRAGDNAEQSSGAGGGELSDHVDPEAWLPDDEEPEALAWALVWTEEGTVGLRDMKQSQKNTRSGERRCSVHTPPLLPDDSVSMLFALET